MNSRQRAFAREYAMDHNGAAAAVRAGYSLARAKYTARDLLNKPDVLDEVAKLDAVTSEELGITKLWIVSTAKTLVERSLAGEIPATVGVRALEFLAKMSGLLVERSVSESTELKVITLTFDKELDDDV